MKTIAKLILFVFTISLLTACGGNKEWQVEVDLTPEDQQAVQVEIKELKVKIKNFEPVSGGAKIAWPEIIDLAAEYEKLGRLDKAIALYNKWFDKGYKTKAMINNVGHLYEKVEEYDLAVAAYQRLVDEYRDTTYYYDITWAYIRGKQRKEAEKAFNKWQQAVNRTDEQTQLAIKKLRAEEKATQQ